MKSEMELDSPRECKCRWCTITSPRIGRIKAALTTEEAKQDFNDFVSDLIHAEDDVNYLNCILDGSWPNWEWIIEERKKRGLWKYEQ